MTADVTGTSIFSRIVAREIPAAILADTERVIAFRDVAPQAPVHVLVVPKTELYRNVVELAAGDPLLLAEMIAMAQRIASAESDGQFRLVFNTGENAGQTVFHVHAHMLSGGLEEGRIGS